jgi:hypothetical protein
MSPDERAKVMAQGENQKGASRNDHQTSENRSIIEPHDLEPVRGEFMTRMEPLAEEAKKASSHAPEIAQQAGASRYEVDQAQRRAELGKGKSHMLETSNTYTLMEAGPSYAQSVQMPISPEHACNDNELKAYILQSEQLQRRLSCSNIDWSSYSKLLSSAWWSFDSTLQPTIEFFTKSEVCMHFSGACSTECQYFDSVHSSRECTAAVKFVDDVTSVNTILVYFWCPTILDTKQL